LILPLATQSQEIFEHSNVTYAINYRHNRIKCDDANTEDIYDGSAYKDIAR